MKVHKFKLICLLLIYPLIYTGSLKADIFVRDDIITSPDVKHFSMCHAHGCKEVEQLSLTDNEWQQIARHFQPQAQSPEAERRQITHAIAEFEQIIGPKTGTAEDKAGLFASMGTPGQLDCIDESTNTTTYLLILEQQGLLKWHKPMNPVTRGFFIFGWPHSSAAMRENSIQVDGAKSHNTANIEDDEYAVDSWFEDNGEPPHIIPLSQWRSGWEPK